MASPALRFARKLLAGSLVLLVGCSTTTTLRLRNGEELEAEIVGGDSRAVYIEGSWQVEAIYRKNIEDIDYPGNVAAAIGGILFLYGIANIVLGAPRCGEEGAAFCAGVFAPAVLGTGIFVYGATVYGTAVNAARQGPRGGYPSFSLRLRLAPTHDVTSQTMRPALSLVGSF